MIGFNGLIHLALVEASGMTADQTALAADDFVTLTGQYARSKVRGKRGKEIALADLLS